MDLQSTTVHGHEVAYRCAGEGPVVLLVHGMAGSSATWEPAMVRLRDRYTVLAPDLAGHGRSAKPRGDYSLGAYASSLRDLLVTLGHERATVVGQSLGGGIAMQMAYQYPDRCERLVLVGSGGLGEEVMPLLRALTAPGVEYVLPIAFQPVVRDAIDGAARAIGKLGLRPSPQLAEMWRAYSSLTDRETRSAFLHTLRAVIDLRGQRVSAHDRLYLASAVPTMIVWGDRDPIIPVAHGHAAHQSIAGSRLEIFAGAGHFPHCEFPERFAETLADFIDTTPAAEITPEVWSRRLVATG